MLRFMFQLLSYLALVGWGVVGVLAIGAWARGVVVVVRGRA
jgi:hypothetical protein